jgi:AcrR family transcriptional regulator
MEAERQHPEPRGGRAAWIEAALDALADGGIERIKIELLAKRLAVTKGGFYWHFRDRAELLAVLLASWRDGRIAAIEEQTRRGAAEARERLLGLVRLYAEGRNPKGMAIELAVRDWARRDQDAAAAAASVDAARLERVARLYEELGCAAADARSRAFLFYAFVFGQSLIFPSRAGERAGLIDGAAALLCSAGWAD